MRHTKRILSLTLALLMTLCFALPAFAAESYTDQSTVTIQKAYLLTNEGTVSPAETFTLEQIGDGVVTDGEAASAPALGAITGAAFPEGGAGGAARPITVALPSYEKVGIYTYTLREVAGTAAGVTYYGGDIRLVVTVINGADGKLRIGAVHTESSLSQQAKSDTFQNEYSAGTLQITKTVTGNLGDSSKYFAFQLTLQGERGKTYAPEFSITGGSSAQNPSTVQLGQTVTVYLKDGETLSVANLPYGVSYSVSEQDYSADGYTTSSTGSSGSITQALQQAAFQNDKGGVIDGGVFLQSLPYVLSLTLAGLGAGVLLLKKRAHGAR